MSRQGFGTQWKGSTCFLKARINVLVLSFFVPSDYTCSCCSFTAFHPACWGSWRSFASDFFWLNSRFSRWSCSWGLWNCSCLMAVRPSSSFSWFLGNHCPESSGSLLNLQGWSENSTLLYAVQMEHSAVFSWRFHHLLERSLDSSFSRLLVGHD